MKKIRSYLDKNNLTQQQFADLLGVSQGLVWQWLNGRTRITAEWAKDIEVKTKGGLKRQDLRADLFSKAA